MNYQGQPISSNVVRDNETQFDFSRSLGILDERRDELINIVREYLAGCTGVEKGAEKYFLQCPVDLQTPGEAVFFGRVLTMVFSQNEEAGRRAEKTKLFAKLIE